jgi:hypothetical protein
MEQVFTTKVMYQSRMPIKAECSIPPIIIIINTRMKPIINANVFKNNESKVR